MIISISGKGASGKTTVAKMLAEKLCYKYYSIGDMMRQLATKKKVSLLELNKMAESNQLIDKWLDKKQENLGKTEDNFVIDSRLAFLFIPRAVKVMLDVTDDDAAKRIFCLPARQGETSYKTMAEARDALIARRESEVRRIRKTYGVDYLDSKHFDLVLDTTKCVPEIVCSKIIRFLKKKKLYKRSNAPADYGITGK